MLVTTNSCVSGVTKTFTKEKQMIKFWLSKYLVELIIVVICQIIYLIIVAWACGKGD